MPDYKDIVPIEKWFTPRLEKPVMICGPCSAETEEQVMATAKAVSRTGKVRIFRSGIWKPRSRPGTFEGIGNAGMEWLKRVKEETGLLVTVEVARPEHVELAVRSGIDIVWIGARSTSNPFSVQELAEALQGSGLPVMVKNPINPDVGLWIGAIERILAAGITRIAAIHRGFYPFERTDLRNLPKWEIPIDLKSRCDQLSVICDPSHISGKRSFIGSIAQKALDLNMDGLMIETHIDPQHALSDKEQQLTPAQLERLLKKLVHRKPDSENPVFIDLLNRYREQIDSLDIQMLELLSRRMQIVENIGQYKKENNVTILQLRRWQEIILSRTKQGNALGLSEEFIKKILQLVHKESIARQEEVFGSTGKKRK
ncbi:MAG: chorismate mutase [Bacteroidetes bacterium]|nr:chorismate mutase [Bacteroidota bacterium]